MTSTMPAAGAGRQRLLVLGGIAAVLLLAALVLPRVLFGGGDAAEDDGAAATTPSTPEGPTAGAADAEDELALDEPLDVVPEAAFSTKNPFTPLVATANTGGAAADTTGDAVDQGSEPTDVPADGTAPAAGTTDATGATGGPSGSTDPVATEPRRPAGRLSIVEIYAGADGAPVATVDVDGAMYTVAVGESFAGGYTVVSLDDGSGAGVFSRDGEQFTVREGEGRLK